MRLAVLVPLGASGFGASLQPRKGQFRSSPVAAVDAPVDAAVDAVTKTPSWLRVRDLGESEYSATHVADGAIPIAKELRDVFDERFSSPRESHAERYLWDPWHVTQRNSDAPARRDAATDAGTADTVADSTSVVAGSAASAVAAARAVDGGRVPKKRTEIGGSGVQYSMLRCPAMEYFPQPLFDELCVQLSDFGRTQLGCDSFTPPWFAGGVGSKSRRCLEICFDTAS
ncbi:hypothetical protein M885DRAFT_303666 [Pelagophyceae sp. CCMP2097]|nr:hypothetical protein M885DRAFT_303666 [Pelagophyceae sp. CCMP2097]